MALVIDASVAASWLLPDEASGAADRIVSTLAAQAAVTPAVFWFEIRNVLAIAERRGRIDASVTDRSLHHLDQLSVETDRDPDQAAAMALVRRHGLTFYDAAYLELAARRRCSLATFDRRLAEAAQREAIAVVA